MQVTKGTWRMREQRVPGSLSSSHAQEPGNKAWFTCDRHYLVHMWPTLLGSHVTVTAWFKCDWHCLVHMWPTLLGSHVTVTAWFTCDRHCLVHMWPSLLGSHVTDTAWFTCDRHCLVHMWPSLLGSHVTDTAWFTCDRHCLVQMWLTLLGSHVTVTAWFTCDRHYLVHMWPSAIIVHSLPFTPLNTHIDSRHVCGRYSLLPRYSSQGNVWHGAGSNWFVTTNGLWLLTVCTKSSLHTISKNLLHITIFHFHVCFVSQYAFPNMAVLAGHGVQEGAQ